MLMMEASGFLSRFPPACIVVLTNLRSSPWRNARFPKVGFVSRGAKGFFSWGFEVRRSHHKAKPKGKEQTGAFSSEESWPKNNRKTRFLVVYDRRIQHIIESSIFFSESEAFFLGGGNSSHRKACYCYAMLVFIFNLKKKHIIVTLLVFLGIYIKTTFRNIHV